MADSLDSMRFFENRLASFSRNANPAKKHQSSQGKTISREWPHETPTPHDLAAAGFWFNPVEGSVDNVSCFMCNVHLGGWEIDDMPLKEHVALAGSCAWAICRSVTRKEEDRDPMSEELMQARLATFAHWPHESNNVYKAKAKTMAENGWCMDPSVEFGDGAMCFYCDLALDGWEADEDPCYEHRKRSPNCPFFILCERRAASRPKKARGRASSTSKARVKAKTSRLSTQSIQSTFSEAPSLMSLGEPVTALDHDTSIGTVTSTASTTKPKRKAAAGKARTKKKVVKKPSMDVVEAANALTYMEDSILPSQIQTQDTQLDVSVTGMGMEQSEMVGRAEPAKKTTQGRPKGKKAVPKEEALDTPLEPSQALDEQLTAAPSHAATRAKRGKKRTSDGVEKDAESLEAGMSVIDEEAAVKPKPTRATRGKKTKAAAEPKAQAEPQTYISDEAHNEAEIVEDSVKPKKGRKAKITKQAKAALPPVRSKPEPDPEPELRTVAEADAVENVQDPEHMVHEDADGALADAERTEGNYEVHDESMENIVVLDRTASINGEEGGGGGEEPSPTPQKVKAFSSKQILTQTTQSESAASSPRSFRSTHSSDAENHPPLSSVAQSFNQQQQQQRRNSSVGNDLAANKPPPLPALSSFPLPPPLSPIRTTRVPLAAQTPNRSPHRSPYKLGLLKSAIPWSATDIEMIFANGGEKDAFVGGQENAYLGIGSGGGSGGGSGVNEKLAKLGGQLSSPERKMTVEEWVRFQAGKGEARLREECERLVWLFEREGQRAIGVLGGVQAGRS